MSHIKNRIIPTHYDSNKGMDIYSRLLDKRVIFVTGEIETDMAEDIVAQLLLLDQDGKGDINMYIDSPGGCVISGLKIIDTMRFIKAKVNTIVTGMAASMGFVILSSGNPGHRYALPNAQIMAHMVSSGARGHIRDMEISFEHSKLLNEKLLTIMADNVGMEKEELRKRIDRDVWLQADEALKFGTKGVIDKIVTKREK